MSHAPVMCAEAVEALAPAGGRAIIDCTFGAGGYSRALLDAGARVLGLDRDPGALAAANALSQIYGERFAFRPTRFSQMQAAAAEAGFAPADGVVMDIGVSSMQLDQAERGFSFRQEGPLDMRMSCEGASAADLVNEAGEKALIAILRRYGEEQRARRIASAIIAERAQSPIDTTGRLAAIVERAVGSGDGRIHPATRTFQALRIAVNDELGELARALSAAERLLAAGGRLVVVTFHSLEDRIVKQFLRLRAGRAPGGSRHAPARADERAPSFDCPSGQPFTPSADEVVVNPRARSAKMRVGVRTQAEAWTDDAHLPAEIWTGGAP